MLLGAENLCLWVMVVELCPCWKSGCVCRRAKETQSARRPRLKSSCCPSLCATTQRPRLCYSSSSIYVNASGGMWPLDCSIFLERDWTTLGLRNNYFRWETWVQSWTLCFCFRVQWAALAKWIPWDNLSTMLAVLSSSTCLVVFPMSAVNNLGLTLYSSAGFAL